MDLDNLTIEMLLQLALKGEYQQWDLYTAYASRLRGGKRHGIAEEFKEHAKEELEHIEVLQRFLIYMGIVPTLERHTIPELPDTATLTDIILLQLKYENEAVELYKKVLEVVPDNDALKLEVENILVKEQEHAQELELFLQEKVTAYFIPTEPGEEVRPQAGYGCSFSKSVWYASLLKDLTPDLYARWNRGCLLSKAEKGYIIKTLLLKRQIADQRCLYRFLDARSS